MKNCGKLGMDMADWRGVPFRLGLSMAERLREAAIRAGFFQVKMPCYSSRARLSLATLADQSWDFFLMVIP
ncbi:MAG TPA: hypothetical protein VMV05_06140 [bacterium]|nr:hypothetical protein [bacterium]